MCSGPILSPRQGQKQQKPQNFGFGLRTGQDGADLDWTGLNRVPIDDSKSPRRRRVHLHGLLVRPSSGQLLIIIHLEVVRYEEEEKSWG